MRIATFLKYAFAEQGDKTQIPVEADPQQGVSINQGYTPPYSNDPSAGGLYILRETFNWIMNFFTKEIQTLQINGINLLDQTILTTIGYPKGSRCVVWLNIQTCQLDRNGADNPLCITAEIVSMKDNNKTDPYSENALFSDWWLDDGFQIGEVRTFQVNLPKAPDGYLDLAPNQASPSYVKDQYPRIKAILEAQNSGKWGFFANLADTPTNFTIINPRGRFPRVWSNGSSIDNGRVFATLQSDAIRNIDGRALIAGGAQAVLSTGNATTLAQQQGLSANYYGALELEKARRNVSGNVFSPVGGYSGDPNLYYMGIKLDVSKQVPTTDTNQGENRPYNFNQKLYIKV